MKTTLEQTPDLKAAMDTWLKGWSPAENAFDAEIFRPIFNADDLLVFDDFGETVRVLTSFDDYAETWTPVMAGFRNWKIELVGESEVYLSGELATVAFTFLGGGDDLDGNPVRLAQRGTHVWQRENGHWKLVHEHLTSDDPAAVAPAT